MASYTGKTKASDLKRWDTLASRVSQESFKKSEDTIFKNYTAKEKAIFNKFEKSMKGLERKYLSGPDTAANVRAANKEEKAILSSFRTQFKDLEQTTGRAANVRANKVYEDDANIKRYGDAAMRAKALLLQGHKATLNLLLLRLVPLESLHKRTQRSKEEANG
tara:strand:- start:91 stop:579 length:489 start_codon:yes stop_codon:yes gene_type:complete